MRFAIMRQYQYIFRRTAWIAILAILLQVLMPVLHPAMAASAAASPHQGIRICSSVAKNLTNSSKATKKTPACPICISMYLMGGGVVPPSDVALATVYFNSTTLVVEHSTVLAVARIALPSQPRAPPPLV